jgi:hypothetical protein
MNLHYHHVRWLICCSCMKDYFKSLKMTTLLKNVIWQCYWTLSLRKQHFTEETWSVLQELPSMQALRTHHQTDHNQAPRFMCAQCSKVYTKYYGFVSHVRRHRNHMKFWYVLLSYWNLKQYETDHNQAPRFICAQCSKVYTKYYGFVSHVWQHQNHMKFCYVLLSYWNLK